MPDAAGVDLNYAIGLAPEDAINYFKKKGFEFTWDWHEVWQDAHAKAFTVAKATKVEVLTEIRSELYRSLKNGTTLEDFKANIIPFLQSKGWWGKTEDGAQLGSDWRLQNIFRTNVQAAYSAGRYKQQAEAINDFPYWQYVAVMDSRTRPTHAALNGLVFKYDDPFWDTHYPPNGFMCRCRVRTYTEKQFEKRGLELSQGDGNIVLENKKINKAGLERPVAGYRDPKTGKTVFTDPGWSSNPGKAAYNPDWGKILEDLKPLPVVPKQWEYIPGTQGGSNPGGVFMSPDGEKHYGKVYSNPDQARCEHLSYQIMKKLKIGGADTVLKEMEWQGQERLVILSKWKDNAVPLNRLMNGTLTKTDKAQLVKHYLNAALTNNWDFVGMNFENLAKVGNTWTELDAGGSFNFRAQGSFKAFTGTADSFDTMIGPGMNPGKFYNGFLKDTLGQDGDKYIKWLKGLTDKSIKEMVKDAGADHEFIAALKGRKADLIKRIESIMAEAAPATPAATRAATGATGALTAAEEATVKQYLGDSAFGRFASGFSETGRMTKTEYAAVRAYTAVDRYYHDINGTLIDKFGERKEGHFTKITDHQLNPLVKAINNGLDKLEKPAGNKVWRGVNLEKSFVDGKYIKGATVEIPGFQSTAVTEEKAWLRNTLFEIRLTGKQGGYVDPISMCRGEKEFLMKSNLKYKVVDIIEGYSFKGNRVTKVILQEL